MVNSKQQPVAAEREVRMTEENAQRNIDQQIGEAIAMQGGCGSGIVCIWGQNGPIHLRWNKATLEWENV